MAAELAGSLLAASEFISSSVESLLMSSKKYGSHCNESAEVLKGFKGEVGCGQFVEMQCGV